MGKLISTAGFWFLGSLLLVVPQPGALWYKHSASPRYHTVGRASGLLIGVRRSPYLWRRDIPTDEEGAGEKTGVTYGLWRRAKSDHQLYPDPGEKITLLEKLYRNLEEERSLDSKETVQNEENIGEVGWNFNKLGGKNSHFEDQSWLAGDQDIVDRSLGENKLMVKESEEEEMGPEDVRSSVKSPALVKNGLKRNHELVMEPGEEKRMLEETWPIIDPGEQVRSLEGEQWLFQEPADEGRNLDRETRGQLESGGDRAPNSEDILSMYLKKNLGDSTAYRQSWRRQLPRDKQLFHPRSKASEWINCEDLAWTSHKILCRTRLQSQVYPRRQSTKAEDTSTPL